MKQWVIIFGAVFLFALISDAIGQDCIYFKDPNDYIEDPNILDNGLFECGDPNISSYSFNAPIFWERIPHPDSRNKIDCYAAVHPFFNTDDPDVEWFISGPVEGENFILLSTGGFSNVSAGDIQGSKIQNMVYLEAGDTILGSYFFGTADYLNYNDYGHISLIFAGDPNQYSDPNDIPKDIVPIPGTECDVEAVGDFGSTLTLSPLTGGWISFSYTLPDPNQAGYYYLCCEVEDLIDKQYTSYYAIDNLRICRGGDPLSDLDGDCDVDLADFSTISLAWLADCNDITNPCSISYDPNIPCELADIDGSRFFPDQNIWVDPNDLAIMSYEWLYDNSE